MPLVRVEHVWWWTEIILAGAFILTGIQFIAFYQEYRIKKKVADTMRELELNTGAMEGTQNE